MSEPTLNLVPLRRTNLPEGIAELPAPDLGSYVSAVSAAKSSILLDNPGAVAFDVVQNAMADFYASDTFSQAAGFGNSLTEGQISEDEFKAVFHTQHPAMVGAWQPGMSWFHAQNRLDRAQLRDSLDWRTSFENNPKSAIVGGLAGGLVDPTTAVTFGGGAPLSKVLPAAARLGYGASTRLSMATAKLGRSAALGFAENAVTELPTEMAQEVFLGENREAADTAISLIAGAVLPPALEVGGHVLNKAIARSSVVNRESIARAAMGEKLDPNLMANMKDNAQSAVTQASLSDEVSPKRSFGPTWEKGSAYDAVHKDFLASIDTLDTATLGRMLEDKSKKLGAPEEHFDMSNPGSAKVLDTVAQEAAILRSEIKRREGAVDTMVRDPSIDDISPSELLRSTRSKLDAYLSMKDPPKAIVEEIKRLTDLNQRLEAAIPARLVSSDIKAERYYRERLYGSLFGNEGPSAEPNRTPTTEPTSQISAQGDKNIVTKATQSIPLADLKKQLGITDSQMSEVKTKKDLDALFKAIDDKRAKDRSVERNRRIDEETRQSERHKVRRIAQDLVDTKGGAQARRDASITSVDLEASLRDIKKYVPNRTAKDSKILANWVQFWREFVAKTGREIRYFDPKNPVHNELFGGGQGAAHYSDTNTVYISIATLDDFNTLAGTIGHEIGHTVLYRSFSEWDNVVSTIVNSGDPQIGKLLRDTLNDFTKHDSFARMSDAKKMDEAIANVFGQVFQSKTFWNKYTEMHGATAFQRLAEFVRRYIKNIVNKVRGFDPDVEKSIGKIYDSVVKAIAAADEKMADGEAIAGTRAYIQDEYGGKFMNLVSRRLTEEERAAIAKADEIAMDMITEVQPEAGDTKSFISRSKGLMSFSSTVKIPLKDTRAFTRLSELERRRVVFGLVFDNPAGSVVRGMLDELNKKRIEALKGNPGASGLPFLTYSIGDRGVDIRIAYPDSHTSISPKIEADVSHSRALVYEWFSDFGYHSKMSEEADAPLTEAAFQLRIVAKMARDRFFVGKTDKGYRSLLDESFEPLVQEFYYSKEFKSIFDAPPEVDADLDAKRFLHELFLEAVQSFRQRKVNEALAEGADIPGSLDTLQDRINEYSVTSHQFLSDEDYAASKITVPEGSARPTNAMLLGTVMEEFLKSIEAARGAIDAKRKLPDPKTLVSLDKETMRQVSESGRAISAAAKGDKSLRGDLTSLQARLALDNDWRVQNYHTLLDTAAADENVPREIFLKYISQVTGTRPRKDLYLEIMDLFYNDVVREVPLHLREEAGTLAKAAETAEWAAGIVGVEKDMDALSDTYIDMVDPTRVYTVDGVTHTHAEHLALVAMRNVFGDRIVNRWISHSGSDIKTSLDKATLAEYVRRKGEDDRRVSKGGGSLSVESKITDMTPAKAAALYDSADALFDTKILGDEEAFREAEQAFREANIDENPEAAFNYTEGLDNMRSPDELLRDVEQNAEAERTRLAPWLKDSVAASKQAHTGTVVQPNNPQLTSLFTMAEKAKRSSDYGKQKTDDFLKEHAAKTITYGALDKSVIHDRVRESAYRALREGKTQPEIRDIIKLVSDEVHDHAVVTAQKDYMAVQNKSLLGTLASVYNSLDGDLRRMGSTVVEMVWNGKLAAPGESLDIKMDQARHNVTYGLNTAIDAIPDLGATGKKKAAILKQARAAHRGDPMTAVPQALRPLFTKLGKAIDDSLELGRGYFNEAGGNVKRNDQFLFSLRHNLAKIRRDTAAWKTQMMSALDWNKVEINALLDKGALSFTKGRNDFLDGMLANLEKAERNSESHPFDPVEDSLASRDQWHRTLAFVDDNAMIDYDVDWGSGDPLLEIVNQLNSRAERSVLMKEWGPSYKENFNHVLDIVRTKPTGKAASLLYSQQEASARIAFDHYAGLLNNPVNERVAAIGQSIRFIGNLAFGWMSTPSSMTDLAGVKNVLRGMGASGYSSLFAQYLKDMATNSGTYSDQVKTLFQGNLAGTEALLSAHARAGVGMGERGYAAQGNKMIFTANGQRRHTTVLQYAITDIMAHRFGEMANDVKSGKGLDEAGRRWLATHKISEAEFTAMAVHADEAQIRMNSEAKTILLPSMIKDRALREKLAFGLKDSMDYGILQPSGSDAALLTFGLRSGTVAGEAIRCITQYKTFSMAMNTKNRRRFRAYDLDPSLTSGKHYNMMTYGAQLLAMGLLATQLKDVLSGKEPLTFVDEDQRNFENVHRVVMQAGLFTAMQDLGVSISNDRQDGWSAGLSSTVLGPIPGQALRVANQLSGDSPNTLAYAARGMVNSTPFSTVPLWNQLKHEIIQGLVSDGYGAASDNIARSMEAQSGQTNLIYRTVQ
jgi:hypothetical protein